METAPIKANLKFLANLDEPLVYIPSKGGGDKTDHVGNFTMQEVSIHDGRIDKQSSSLDVEGFRLVSQKTEVQDFYDDVQVESTYHEEVKALLMEMTGAARIEIFDDTRRSSSLEQQQAKKIREPADIVHNDYTARSGVKRLRDHFADDPNEADKLLQRRFAIVNVWRSIAGPVYNYPLVLCDAATVGPVDQEALFYLQSRGLAYRAALQLLVSGFFSSVVEGIPMAGLEAELAETVSAKLATAEL